jgi:glycosyltransferase involved in cell wall biosynthesis
MTPLLSIIMPCYNHGQYIEEAIGSVELCADKHLYELIILNDGSTDACTVQVLEQLSQKGYNVVHQKNQGLGAARNNAIKLAKGKYILPLDSDNRIRPAYIYEGIKVLEASNEVAVVYGDAEFFGEKTGRNQVGEFNLQRIMLGNYIDACAVFRKSVWEELGGYDEKMPVMGVEDWDFWLRTAFKGYRFVYINEVLFDYRVLKNSMLRSIDNDRKMLVSAYLETKHKENLNFSFINDLIVYDFRKNKKLVFKLMLAVLFPSLLDYLVRKKLIKNKRVFL